jgi:hypothetical protein
MASHRDLGADMDHFLPRLVPLLLVLVGPTLCAQPPTPLPEGPKVRVTIVVTLEDSPCLEAKVVIKPLGRVENWPEPKPNITLITDRKGRATVQLGPGAYRAIAYDPLHTKLPADGWFRIAASQCQPEKIHLNLLYWDCSHVTCML